MGLRHLQKVRLEGVSPVVQKQYNVGACVEATWHAPEDWEISAGVFCLKNNDDVYVSIDAYELTGAGTTMKKID